MGSLWQIYMRAILRFGLALALVAALTLATDEHTHEQVHLVATADEGTVLACWTWRGPKRLVDPAVRFGLAGLSADQIGRANRTETLVTENGYHGWHYCVAMSNAASRYAVGDAAADEWSYEFVRQRHRVEQPSGAQLVWNFAVVGDVDVKEASERLLRALSAEIMPLHAWLLPGDLSYAQADPSRWDRFGRLAEPVAARLPVIVCTGNHEHDHQPLAANFLARMPRPGSRLYFAVDFGPLHIVSLTSGTDGTPPPTDAILPYAAVRDAQLAWLRAELASYAASRTRRTWLVVMIHQPLFSSGPHQPPAQLVADMQPLFRQYAVDLVLSGHNHGFEISRPDGVPGAVIGRDRGPVYIVVGTGGFGRHPLPDNLPAWAAHQDTRHGLGYAVLSVVETAQSPVSTLRLRFVSVDDPVPTDWLLAMNKDRIALLAAPVAIERSLAGALVVLSVLGLLAVLVYRSCLARLRRTSASVV